MQGREESNGGEIGEQTAGALPIAPIEVERVTEGLEGIEGKSERE